MTYSTLDKIALILELTMFYTIFPVLPLKQKWSSPGLCLIKSVICSQWGYVNVETYKLFLFSSVWCAFIHGLTAKSSMWTLMLSQAGWKWEASIGPIQVHLDLAVIPSKWVTKSVLAQGCRFTVSLEGLWGNKIENIIRTRWDEAWNFMTHFVAF